MPHFKSSQLLGLFSFFIMTSTLSLLLAACGEQNKVYNVAVYAESYNQPSRLTGLKDGLKALGYTEGQNINIQTLDVTTMTPEQGKAALKDLVAKNFDAYVVINSASATSLKELVGNKPILGAGIEEPVRLGLAQSSERPGSNVTGIDYTLNELILRDLGWMLKINPDIHQVYLLYNPQNPSQTTYLDTIRAEANRLKVTLVEKTVAPQEMVKTITQLKHTDGQAVLLLDFATPYIATKQLKEVVQQEKLLMNGIEPGNYDVGAAFIYNANDYSIGRQSAPYLDKLLHGGNPAELPLLQPEKLELHLNQKVADQLGFKFPQAVLTSADEVIR